MLREALLTWSGVTLRRMFGSHGLFVDGRLFAVVEDDAVATKLPREAYDRAKQEPFQPVPDRPFGQWLQFPLGGHEGEQDLLTWLRQGYEYVKSTPPSTRRRSRASGKPAPRRRA